MKKGSVDWTVGRLMTAVLVVVVLVIVVFGWSSAVKPLVERVGGMGDEVKIFFAKFFGGGGESGECVEDMRIVDMGGGKELLEVLGVSEQYLSEAIFRVCRQECRISTVGGGVYWISSGGLFDFRDIGTLGNEWSNYLFLNGDADLTNFYWELYNQGIGEVKKKVGVSLLNSFYGGIYFRLRAEEESDKKIVQKVAEWSTEGWIVKTHSGVFGDDWRILYEGDDDEDAIDVFLNEVNKGLDDDVFYESPDGFVVEDISDGKIYRGFPFGEEKRWISDIVGGDRKMDSEEKEKLIRLIPEIKGDLLKKVGPSREETDAFRGDLSDGRFEAGGKIFELGLVENGAYPLILFSNEESGDYGLKYYPSVLKKSEKLKTSANGDYISLVDNLPFVLVFKRDDSWVRVGNEGEYKLPESFFKDSYKINKAYEFFLDNGCG